MSNISFSQFNFHNDNGIDAVISLDANGTSVIQNQNVPSKGSFTKSLNINNVQNVKISVATNNLHPTDTETIDVTKAGTPYSVYLTKLTAHSSIGIITGYAEFAFGNP